MIPWRPALARPPPKGTVVGYFEFRYMRCLSRKRLEQLRCTEEDKRMVTPREPTGPACHMSGLQRTREASTGGPLGTKPKGERSS
ncbi:MAG: hypothetical protein JWO19_4494 [Bryobacterales bacterium]|nr:hypothetical protein [Bryobacterales bacterium]